MILRVLKSATAEAHRRVESALPSLEALGTRPAYLACLGALHGFYAAWEPAVWPAVSSCAPTLARGRREKLPSLRADLTVLHRLLRTTPDDGVAPSPAMTSGAAALGALYVFEGATLGGRVIERHAAHRLGLTPEHGLAFFHGYGERTGEMWRTFGDGLTEWVARHGASEAVVAGAVACFGALEQWLAEAPQLARVRELDGVVTHA